MSFPSLLVVFKKCLCNFPFVSYTLMPMIVIYILLKFNQKKDLVTSVLN